MRNAIVIGMLGLGLCPAAAAAQTVSEQNAILRDFQRSVADYVERHQCLALLPQAIDAATPAPKIFTLPVAMVFRQLVAQAIAGPEGVPVMSGVGTTHRAMEMQTYPGSELADFPAVLRSALPALPAPLEYRLIDRDLVIRDGDADVIVAVLRDAFGRTITTKR